LLCQQQQSIYRQTSATVWPICWRLLHDWQDAGHVLNGKLAALEWRPHSVAAFRANTPRLSEWGQAARLTLGASGRHCQSCKLPLRPVAILQSCSRPASISAIRCVRVLTVDALVLLAQQYAKTPLGISSWNASLRSTVRGAIDCRS